MEGYASLQELIAKEKLTPLHKAYLNLVIYERSCYSGIMDWNEKTTPCRRDQAIRVKHAKVLIQKYNTLISKYPNMENSEIDKLNYEMNSFNKTTTVLNNLSINNNSFLRDGPDITDIPSDHILLFENYLILLRNEKLCYTGLANLNGKSRKCKQNESELIIRAKVLIKEYNNAIMRYSHDIFTDVNSIIIFTNLNSKIEGLNNEFRSLHTSPTLQESGSSTLQESGSSTLQESGSSQEHLFDFVDFDFTKKVIQQKRLPGFKGGKSRKGIKKTMRSRRANRKTKSRR